ncbi:unnamed protein product [Amoebophrya sp. A120]|nr:unnamed protein product [Amoebophrya sp. A120]|eukprot:GSA120T00004146001.1
MADSSSMIPLAVVNKKTGTTKILHTADAERVIGQQLQAAKATVAISSQGPVAHAPTFPKDKLPHGNHIIHAKAHNRTPRSASPVAVFYKSSADARRASTRSPTASRRNTTVPRELRGLYKDAEALGGHPGAEAGCIESICGSPAQSRSGSPKRGVAFDTDESGKDSPTAYTRKMKAPPPPYLAAERTPDRTPLEKEKEVRWLRNEAPHRPLTRPRRVNSIEGLTNPKHAQNTGKVPKPDRLIEDPNAIKDPEVIEGPLLQPKVEIDWMKQFQATMDMQAAMKAVEQHENELWQKHKEIASRVQFENAKDVLAIDRKLEDPCPGMDRPNIIAPRLLYEAPAVLPKADEIYRKTKALCRPAGSSRSVSPTRSVSPDGLAASQPAAAAPVVVMPPTTPGAAAVVQEQAASAQSPSPAFKPSPPEPGVGDKDAQASKSASKSALDTADRKIDELLRSVPFEQLPAGVESEVRWHLDSLKQKLSSSKEATAGLEPGSAFEGAELRVTFDTTLEEDNKEFGFKEKADGTWDRKDVASKDSISAKQLQKAGQFDAKPSLFKLEPLFNPGVRTDLTLDAKVRKQRERQTVRKFKNAMAFFDHALGMEVHTTSESEQEELSQDEGYESTGDGAAAQKKRSKSKSKEHHKHHHNPFLAAAASHEDDLAKRVQVLQQKKKEKKEEERKRLELFEKSKLKKKDQIIDPKRFVPPAEVKVDKQAEQRIKSASLSPDIGPRLTGKSQVVIQQAVNPKQAVSYDVKSIEAPELAVDYMDPIPKPELSKKNYEFEARSRLGDGRNAVLRETEFQITSPVTPGTDFLGKKIQPPNLNITSFMEEQNRKSKFASSSGGTQRAASLSPNARATQKDFARANSMQNRATMQFYGEETLEDEIIMDDEMEAAALRIQSIKRGKQARREVEAKRRQSVEEKEAAVRIQAVHRGKQTRRSMREEREAATKVQAIHRGRATRRQMAQRGGGMTREDDYYDDRDDFNEDGSPKMVLGRFSVSANNMEQHLSRVKAGRINFDVRAHDPVPLNRKMGAAPAFQHQSPTAQQSLSPPRQLIPGAVGSPSGRPELRTNVRTNPPKLQPSELGGKKLFGKMPTVEDFMPNADQRENARLSAHLDDTLSEARQLLDMVKKLEKEKRMTDEEKRQARELARQQEQLAEQLARQQELKRYSLEVPETLQNPEKALPPGIVAPGQEAAATASQEKVPGSPTSSKASSRGMRKPRSQRSVSLPPEIRTSGIAADDDENVAPDGKAASPKRTSTRPPVGTRAASLSPPNVQLRQSISLSPQLSPDPQRGRESQVPQSRFSLPKGPTAAKAPLPADGQLQMPVLDLSQAMNFGAAAPEPPPAGPKKTETEHLSTTVISAFTLPEQTPLREVLKPPKEKQILSPEDLAAQRVVAPPQLIAGGVSAFGGPAGRKVKLLFQVKKADGAPGPGPEDVEAEKLLNQLKQADVAGSVMLPGQGSKSHGRLKGMMSKAINQALENSQVSQRKKIETAKKLAGKNPVLLDYVIQYEAGEEAERRIEAAKPIVAEVGTQMRFEAPHSSRPKPVRSSGTGVPVVPSVYGRSEMRVQAGASYLATSSEKIVQANPEMRENFTDSILPDLFHDKAVSTELLLDEEAEDPTEGMTHGEKAVYAIVNTFVRKTKNSLLEMEGIKLQSKEMGGPGANSDEENDGLDGPGPPRGDFGSFEASSGGKQDTSAWAQFGRDSEHLVGKTQDEINRASAGNITIDAKKAKQEELAKATPIERYSAQNAGASIFGKSDWTAKLLPAGQKRNSIDVGTWAQMEVLPGFEQADQFIGADGQVLQISDAAIAPPCFHSKLFRDSHTDIFEQQKDLLKRLKEEDGESVGEEEEPDRVTEAAVSEAPPLSAAPSTPKPPSSAHSSSSPKLWKQLRASQANKAAKQEEWKAMIADLKTEEMNEKKAIPSGRESVTLKEGSKWKTMKKSFMMTKAVAAVTQKKASHFEVWDLVQERLKKLQKAGDLNPELKAKLDALENKTQAESKKLELLEFGANDEAEKKVQSLVGKGTKEERQVKFANLQTELQSLSSLAAGVTTLNDAEAIEEKRKKEERKKQEEERAKKLQEFMTQAVTETTEVVDVDAPLEEIEQIAEAELVPEGAPPVKKNVDLTPQERESAIEEVGKTNKAMLLLMGGGGGAASKAASSKASLAPSEPVGTAEEVQKAKELASKMDLNNPNRAVDNISKLKNKLRLERVKNKTQGFSILAKLKAATKAEKEKKEKAVQEARDKEEEIRKHNSWSGGKPLDATGRSSNNASPLSRITDHPEPTRIIPKAERAARIETTQKMRALLGPSEKQTESEKLQASSAANKTDAADLANVNNLFAAAAGAGKDASAGSSSAPKGAAVVLPTDKYTTPRSGRTSQLKQTQPFALYKEPQSRGSSGERMNTSGATLAGSPSTVIDLSLIKMSENSFGVNSTWGLSTGPLPDGEKENSPENQERVVEVTPKSGAAPLIADSVRMMPALPQDEANSELKNEEDRSATKDIAIGVGAEEPEVQAGAGASVSLAAAIVEKGGAGAAAAAAPSERTKNGDQNVWNSDSDANGPVKHTVPAHQDPKIQQKVAKLRQALPGAGAASSSSRNLVAVDNKITTSSRTPKQAPPSSNRLLRKIRDNGNAVEQSGRGVLPKNTTSSRGIRPKTDSTRRHSSKSSERRSQRRTMHTEKELQEAEMKQHLEAAATSPFITSTDSNIVPPRDEIAPEPIIAPGTPPLSAKDVEKEITVAVAEEEPPKLSPLGQIAMFYQEDDWVDPLPEAIVDPDATVSSVMAQLERLERELTTTLIQGPGSMIMPASWTL